MTRPKTKVRHKRESAHQARMEAGVVSTSGHTEPGIRRSRVELGSGTLFLSLLALSAAPFAAAAQDAGASDAGVTDAGLTDAGADAGPKDGGTDGGTLDGGATDGGTLDGGTDAGAPPPVPVPYFTEMTDQAFPNPACQDTRAGCYTSWLVMSDIDSDGDLDVAFANGGGYYAIGSAEDSVVYFNDGYGAFVNVTGTMFKGAKNRNRQVVVGDIDGDGDKDIYQPSGFGFDAGDKDKLWIQVSPGVFEDRAAAQLPGTLLSTVGAAQFGDVDNDGDLDIAIADWGRLPVRNSTGTGITPGKIWIYKNDGTGFFALQPTSTTPPGRNVSGTGAGRTPIDVDLEDVDNDFDLDILVNMRDGQSQLFLNNGTGKFTDATDGNYPAKRGPYAYNQDLCDIDEDGDLDLLVDNTRASTPVPGRTSILINDGKGKFTEVGDERIVGEPGGDDNAVKCADINGDGHYDLIVACLGTVGEKVLINNGSGIFNYVYRGLPANPNLVTTTGSQAGQVRDDATLGIDVGDVDGDGMLDVVTGQGEGTQSFIDRLYYGSNNSKPDSTPPKFRAIEQPVPVPGKEIVIRFATEDAVTSETGEHVMDVKLTYSGLGVVTATVPAVFVGGDLFRAVIPPQADGTLLTINLSAMDRNNNMSLPQPFNLMVGTPYVEPDAGTPDAGIDDDASVDMDGGEVPDAEVEEDAGSDEMVDAGSAVVDAGKKPDAGKPSVGDEEMPDERGGEEDAGDGTETPAEPTGGKSDDGCSVTPGKQSKNGLLEMALFGLAALGVRTRRRRQKDGEIG